MKIRSIVNQRRRGIEVEGTIVDIAQVPLARSRKTLMKATLGDETGSITLNLWGSQSLKCKEGDRVKITNGYTSKSSGKFELNIDSGDDIMAMDSE
ncbi:MAG: hypothetical protein JSV27_06940 [Candidatus Bathyarchaeota archaeon]|nr:MAG: hypothetical protein JSV27_06940 [Candidatus Bathyarchaeota archaeon]